MCARVSWVRLRTSARRAARYSAATSALGVMLPSMLLKAADTWSTWVLNTSAGGQFATRLTEVLQLPNATAGVVIVLGIVSIVIVAFQAVLMMFRQAALVILAFDCCGRVSS